MIKKKIPIRDNLLEPITETLGRTNYEGISSGVSEGQRILSLTHLKENNHMEFLSVL